MNVASAELRPVLREYTMGELGGWCIVTVVVVRGKTLRLIVQMTSSVQLRWRVHKHAQITTLPSTCLLD